MWDKVAAIIGSIFAVATVTTLVLPGRQTPAVVREGTSGLAKIVSASIGR
jgi:hypothetical protein